MPRLCKTPKVSIGTTYRLEGEDYAFAVYIGHMRNKKNKAKGVKEQKFTASKSSVEVSVQGLIGEAAFLRLFGLPLDPLYDTTPSCARTDRGDAFLQSGEKVDVKTTVPRAKGILASAAKKEYPPTLYALMTMLDHNQEGHYALLRFDGFMSAAFVTQDRWETRKGKGGRFVSYLAPRAYLKSLSDVRMDFGHTESREDLGVGEVFSWDVRPSQENWKISFTREQGGMAGRKR